MYSRDTLPRGSNRLPMWNLGPKSHIWYGFWVLIPFWQSKWTLWAMYPPFRTGTCPGAERPDPTHSDTQMGTGEDSCEGAGSMWRVVYRKRASCRITPLLLRLEWIPRFSEYMDPSQQAVQPWK